MSRPFLLIPIFCFLFGYVVASKDLLLGVEGRREAIQLKLYGPHFVGPITIEGKQYSVAFSFSAASAWVLSSSRLTKIWLDQSFSHEYYNVEDIPEVSYTDDSAEATENVYATEYLDGLVVTGLKVEVSSFEAGGITVSPMDIGVVDKPTPVNHKSDVKWITSYMDGVLGLGFTDFEIATKSPFEQLMSQEVDFAGFSLYIANDGQYGELLLGAKREDYYRGPLNYVPVPDDANNWVVQGNVFMGDSSLTQDTVSIEVNLASNAIWAPRPVINKIIGLTNGKATWQGDDQVHVMIDCAERDSLPEMIFEFSGVPHAFKPDEYFPEFTVPGYRVEGEMRCTLFMMPSEALPVDEDDPEPLHPDQVWSLGVPFFKKYYSVYEEFQQGRKKTHRVGFAETAHDIVEGMGTQKR